MPLNLKITFRPFKQIFDPCTELFCIECSISRRITVTTEEHCAGICQGLWSPGIDSSQAGNRFLGSLKDLQIRALFETCLWFDHGLITFIDTKAFVCFPVIYGIADPTSCCFIGWVNVL
jgi:hypothetical protein